MNQKDLEDMLLVECWLYYDEPLVFLAVHNDTFVIAMLTDCATEGEWWHYFEMPKNLIHSIREGHLAFEEVVKSLPDGIVHEGLWRHDGSCEVTTKRFKDIQERLTKFTIMSGLLDDGEYNEALADLGKTYV